MANLFKASQSKVKLWRKCKQAWWYKYKLMLRRKTVARPLMFGRLVHDMIEAHSNGDDPHRVLVKAEKEQGKMFRSQAEEYGDILNDARIIMSEYFSFWPEDNLVPVRLKGKAAEHTFEVEVSEGIVATGKIDNIAKSKNKLRWLTEHKSGARMLGIDHMWRNLQSVLYIRINDMLGLPALDGTCWDYIRSKPPSAPKLLKNGSMSKRGIDTLPLKVLETLKQLKLSPSKFGFMMKNAEANRKNYFQRVFTPVKEKVANKVYNDFVTTAREMADTSHNLNPVRNIDRHCDWCEFENICRAELLGLDHDFIIKKDYDKVPKQPDTEPDFEA